MGKRKRSTEPINEHESKRMKPDETPSLEKMRKAASAELDMLLQDARIYRAPKDTKRKKQKKSKRDEDSDDDDYLPGWEFTEDPVPKPIAKHIQSQLKYIAQMKQGWRPIAPKKMEMPEDWFSEETTIILSNNRPYNPPKYDREQINCQRMSFYLEPISEHLDRISTKNLTRRHLSTRYSQRILPDFCLQFRSARGDKDDESMKDKESMKSWIEISPTLERWLDIVNFPMGEHNVDLTMQSVFTNIPACWLLIKPELRFIEPLEVEKPLADVEFAAGLISVRPCRKEEVEAARELPISWSNPSLILAMKGPIPWPETLQKWEQPENREAPDWIEATDEEKLEFCLNDLALAVQPSLDSMVITWMRRVEQQVVPQQKTETQYPIYPPASKDSDIGDYEADSDDQEEVPEQLSWKEIPEWAWIPGILYDWKSCILVAHIPILPRSRLGSVPVSYVSYIIDEIPFLRPPSGDADDRECIVERVRLGLALMALAKHAFKLSSLWDSVIPPLEVARWEELALLKDNNWGRTGRSPSPPRAPPRMIDLEEWEGFYSREPSVAPYGELGLTETVFTLNTQEKAEDAEHRKKSGAHMHQLVESRIQRWLKKVPAGKDEWAPDPAI